MWPTIGVRSKVLMHLPVTPHVSLGWLIQLPYPVLGWQYTGTAGATAVDTVQRTAQVYSLPAEARPHQALWHINLVGATSDLNTQMPKCQQQQSLPICRLHCTAASKHPHCLLPSLRTPFPFPLHPPTGTKPPPTLFARRMSQ